MTKTLGLEGSRRTAVRSFVTYSTAVGNWILVVLMVLAKEKKRRIWYVKYWSNSI